MIIEIYERGYLVPLHLNFEAQNYFATPYEMWRYVCDTVNMHRIISSLKEEVK